MKKDIMIAGVDDKDSIKALGIRAYTMKPLVMRDLAKTVRKVLDAGQPVR